MLWADRFSFLFFSIQPRSKISKLSIRIDGRKTEELTSNVNLTLVLLARTKKPLVVTFVAVKKSSRILLATLLMHAFLTWCYNSSHLK